MHNLKPIREPDLTLVVPHWMGNAYKLNKTRTIENDNGKRFWLPQEQKNNPVRVDC